MILINIFQFQLIEPCVATIDYVRTMDNVTYSYAPQGANTLMSGHCAENPSYAVFVKKNGGKLAMTAFIGGHKIEIAGGNITTVMCVTGDAAITYRNCVILAI